MGALEDNAKVSMANLERWALGVVAVDGEKISPDDLERIARALAFSRKSFDNLSRIIEPMRNSHPEMLEATYGELFVLMDTSITLGALALFTPLARRELVKFEGAKGGKTGAATRKRQAEETWIPIAKEMIRDIRARKPGASQDIVVGDIDSEWKSSIRLPGSRWLKKLLSQMEESGEVPRMMRQPKKS